MSNHMEYKDDQTRVKGSEEHLEYVCKYRLYLRTISKRHPSNPSKYSEVRKRPFSVYYVCLKRRGSAYIFRVSSARETDRKCVSSTFKYQIFRFLS